MDSVLASFCVLNLANVFPADPAQVQRPPAGVREEWPCLVDSPKPKMGTEIFLKDNFWFQLSPVAQSCLTLCDPVDCSMPGLPVHHQLPELTQTHVH